MLLDVMETLFTYTGVCKLLELLRNESLMRILVLCSRCLTKDLHFLQLQKRLLHPYSLLDHTSGTEEYVSKVHPDRQMFERFVETTLCKIELVTVMSAQK